MTCSNSGRVPTCCPQGVAVASSRPQWRKLEGRTGLDFFRELPSALQHSLESSVQTLQYGGSQ
jgi:hypothetical protein